MQQSTVALDQGEQPLHDPVDPTEKRAQSNRKGNHYESQILGRFSVWPRDLLQFGEGVEPPRLDLVELCTDAGPLVDAWPLAFRGWLWGPSRFRPAERGRCRFGDRLALHVHLLSPSPNRLSLARLGTLIGGGLERPRPRLLRRRSAPRQGRQDSNLQPAVLETA